MGRASLREGLRILEIQGLITIKPGPGGGPVVAAANGHDFGRMTTLHYQALARHVPRAGRCPDDHRAAHGGLAGRSRDPEIIAALRASPARAAGLSDDSGYSDSATDFHVLIMPASGNRILSLFAESLRDVYYDRGRARCSRSRTGRRCSGRTSTSSKPSRRATPSGRATDARAHGAVPRLRGRALSRMLDEVVDWR